MSLELTRDPAARPAADVGHPITAVHARDTSPPVLGGRPPRGPVTDAGTDTVEALLVSVARGDLAAFVVLHRRMAGLVQVNIRRILRDASRAEALTQELFAEVLAAAIHFDPGRDSAQAWLLTRAHQHAMDGLRAMDGTHDPVGARLPTSTD